MQMLHRAGLQGHVVRVDEDSDALLDLVGETAPLVEGWSLEDFTRRNRKTSRDSRDSRRGGYGHRGYGSRDNRDGSDRRHSGRGNRFRRSDRFEHADRFDRSDDAERSNGFDRSDRSDYRDDRRGGHRDGDFNRGPRSHDSHRNFRNDSKFDSRRDFHDHAESRHTDADNDDWSKPFDGRSDKRRNHAESYDRREDQSHRGSGDYRHSDNRRHSSYDDRGRRDYHRDAQRTSDR
jgi:hypothetical protein